MVREEVKQLVQGHTANVTERRLGQDMADSKNPCPAFQLLFLGALRGMKEPEVVAALNLTLKKQLKW